MIFRFLIIALCLSTTPLLAQKRLVKKWLSLEKSFLHYFSDMQDYPKAAAYMDEIWELTTRKFPKEDSLFAAAVATKSILSFEQDQYDHCITFLRPWSKWLRTRTDAGEALTKRHYNWLLYAGNAYVMLGESYMFDKNIPTIPSFVPKDMEDRFHRALVSFDTAILLYKELAVLRPEHPDLNNNLSVTYRNKGRALGQYLGDLEGCIGALKESINYKADLENYRLLGVAYGVSGQHFKAIESFEKALALDTYNAAILYNLEVAFQQLSSMTENEVLKSEYLSKADSYHMQWKLIDPDYDPSQN